MTNQVKVVFTKDIVEVRLVLVVSLPSIDDFVFNGALVGDGEKLDCETVVNDGLTGEENRGIERATVDWWEDEPTVLIKLTTVVICRDDHIPVVVGGLEIITVEL